MSRDADRIEELLAAYADGGLDAVERARVEAYLDDHPDAAAEVAALRAVINETRAGQPRPASEPDWTAMRRAIADEVGGYGSVPAPSWWRRLLRPRYGLTAAVAAAAVVVAILATGGDRPATAPVTDDSPIVAVAAPEPLELRASRVADLEAEELDDLLAELDPADLTPDDDEILADPVLSADQAALWAGDVEAEPILEIGLFDDPELDALLDDLSEEELSELDAFLADQTG